jgi:hypothetical protein
MGFAQRAGFQANERREWPAVGRARGAGATNERRTFPDN